MSTRRRLTLEEAIAVAVKEKRIRQRQRQEDEQAHRESLLDFVPRISPKFWRPDHLAELAAFIEEAAETGRPDHDPIRVASSVPPRHSKTELYLHGIAWILRRRPELTIGYATYNDELAAEKSDRARDLAKAAGVRIRTGSNLKKRWQTTAGGGVIAAGVNGGWSGRGVDILIIDDPHKNRLEAESSTMRERVWDFYIDAAYTRLEPNGSAFVNHTRWHRQDLIGRVTHPDSGEKFANIRFSAILDEDDPERRRPLWPKRWTLEGLDRVRRTVGNYSWRSVWQQDPINRGGSLFQDVHYYEELPEGPFKIGIGVDLAYSNKTRADHSVIVVFFMKKDENGLPVYYVIDVVERQELVTEFRRHLLEAKRDFPGQRFVFRFAGPEKGVGELLKKDHKIPLNLIPTSGDKFVNAQPYAGDWNDGRVLVPLSSKHHSDPPPRKGRDLAEAYPPPRWVSRFVDQHLDFTGLDGEEDDIVDGAISARLGATQRIALR